MEVLIKSVKPSKQYPGWRYFFCNPHTGEPVKYGPYVTPNGPVFLIDVGEAIDYVKAQGDKPTIRPGW